MNMKTILALLIFGLAASVAANAQQNELGWTMDSAVKQLDRQGSDFATLLADIEMQWSGSEQGETETERGRLYMNKKGDLRINVDTPNKQTILRVGRTVSYYDPVKATVQEFSLSKHKDRLEVFVPLGFSTTGKNLTRDYLVTFIGEKDIGSRRTLGLELTPKRDNVRAVVSRIELWVDEASWLPVRQVISQSSGGRTLTIVYVGPARNLALNSDLFRAKWPKGTKKVRM